MAAGPGWREGFIVAASQATVMVTMMGRCSGDGERMMMVVMMEKLDETTGDHFY